MYKIRISATLERILRKLSKKDLLRYEIVLKKIKEISESETHLHYKNLKHDLKEFKRVHIDSHFVLVFNVDEKKKIVDFLDLQHHDAIYRK
jgi:YafQ family addiction module toxin component